MAQPTLEFEKPLLELELKMQELRGAAVGAQVDVQGELRTLELKAERLRKEIYSRLSAWQRVQLFCANSS